MLMPLRSACQITLCQNTVYFVPIPIIRLPPPSYALQLCCGQISHRVMDAMVRLMKIRHHRGQVERFGTILTPTGTGSLCSVCGKRLTVGVTTPKARKSKLPFVEARAHTRESRDLHAPCAMRVQVSTRLRFVAKSGASRSSRQVPFHYC